MTRTDSELQGMARDHLWMRVFSSTGGGEAVETAFKLAKQYWKLAGQPTKHKVISRAVAYAWNRI